MRAAYAVRVGIDNKDSSRAVVQRAFSGKRDAVEGTEAVVGLVFSAMLAA